MSIAEKLTTIAENEQKVYDAGAKSEYDRFWGSYQNNGKRTNYNGAFYGSGWNNETFKPKHDIKPTGNNAVSMFRETAITGDLKTILEKLGVVLDTSGVTSFSYCFYNNKFEGLPFIDLSNNGNESISIATAYVFANNSNLKRLEIKVSKTTTYSNIFNSCSALEELTVTGTIGQNGFSVSPSTKLTHDSLMSIINALYNYSGSGTTYTVTLGKTNLAKLTDAEKAVATEKGWTLA